MIGLDTNILVRFLTRDDAGQHRRVEALIDRAIESNVELFVDHVVLCEIVWVLRVRYGHDRPAIAATLDELLDSTVFVYEDRALLRAAIHAYRAGPGDFSDYLIGLRNARAGCDHTVTFDRALKAHSSFVLL